MAGLVPAIHASQLLKEVDARDKRGHHASISDRRNKFSPALSPKR
jgi:hypothetical protein